MELGPGVVTHGRGASRLDAHDEYLLLQHGDRTDLAVHGARDIADLFGDVDGCARNTCREALSGMAYEGSQGLAMALEAASMDQLPGLPDQHDRREHGCDAYRHVAAVQHL